MKIGIGTTQFGMNYGISNCVGKTDKAEVKHILCLAQENGVKVLDTAQSYGDSEEILGGVLRENDEFSIITKISALNVNCICIEQIDLVKKKFYRSLDRLSKNRVYGLMVHHAPDLLLPGGERLVAMMEDLRAQGFVDRIGVSVYGPEIASELFSKYGGLDLIQLPLNVFDQRFIRGNILKELKARGVEIHVRSAFLQGLLLMSPLEMSPYFEAIKEKIWAYHNFLKSLNVSPLQAALGLCQSVEEADVVLVGVNDHIQLKEIISVSDIRLDPDDFVDFFVSDEAYINPSRWKL